MPQLKKETTYPVLQAHLLLPNPTPSMDTNLSCHGTGFLGQLEPSIKRFPYEGKQEFNRIMSQEYQRRTQSNCPTEKWSEWALFTDLDEKTFTRDFEDPTQETGRIDDWTANCPSYDGALHLLLTKMYLSPHEVATREFELQLRGALVPMGLDHAVLPLGHTTVFATSDRKEPDASWVPRRPPHNHPRNMPTVVLEGALSEPQSKLSSDVRFWVGQAHRGLKVVLTLAIDRKRPEITIEKWEPGNHGQHRTGRIQISMDKKGQIKVDGGPLVIEFEKFFLRPAEDNREIDITIDTDMLEVLATEIWEAQEFVE